MGYIFTITQTQTPVITIQENATPTVVISGTTETFNLQPPAQVNVSITSTSVAYRAGTDVTQIQTVNLANVFKGEWDANTGYQRGDTVRHLNLIYVAEETITAFTPNAEPQGDARWALIFGNADNTLTIEQIQALLRAQHLLPWNEATTYQLYDWIWDADSHKAYILTDIAGSLDHPPTANLNYWTPLAANLTGANGEVAVFTVTNKLTVAGIRYPITKGYLGQVLSTNGENEADWVTLRDVAGTLSSDLVTNNFNILPGSTGKLTIGNTGINTSSIAISSSTMSIRAANTLTVGLTRLSNGTGLNAGRQTTQLVIKPVDTTFRSLTDYYGNPVNSFNFENGAVFINNRSPNAYVSAGLGGEGLAFQINGVDYLTFDTQGSITSSLTFRPGVASRAGNPGQGDGQIIFAGTNSNITFQKTGFVDFWYKSFIKFRGAGSYIEFPDGTTQTTAFTTAALPVFQQADATHLGGIRLGYGFGYDPQTGLTNVSGASRSLRGAVQVGTNIGLDSQGVISVATANANTLGLVKIGSGINLAGDGTISVTSGTYVLPTASANILGGIKLGNSLTINTSTGVANIITATNSVLGGVKIGSGINITTSGTISVTPYSLPAATTSTLGGVKIGDGLNINTTTGVVSVIVNNTLTATLQTNGYDIAYSTSATSPKINIASDNIVITDGINSRIRVDSTGTHITDTDAIYLSSSYTQIGNENDSHLRVGVISDMSGSGAPLAAYGIMFPDQTVQYTAFNGTFTDITGIIGTATSIKLGGVKIGTGIDISGSGAISPAPATTTTIGGVKIGSGINVSSSGVISTTPATSSVLGGIKVGDNLTITADGVLSSTATYQIATARYNRLGGILAYSSDQSGFVASGPWVDAYTGQLNFTWYAGSQTLQFEPEGKISGGGRDIYGGKTPDIQFSEYNPNFPYNQRLNQPIIRLASYYESGNDLSANPSAKIQIDGSWNNNIITINRARGALDFSGVVTNTSTVVIDNTGTHIFDFKQIDLTSPIVKFTNTATFSRGIRFSDGTVQTTAGGGISFTDNQDGTVSGGGFTLPLLYSTSTAFGVGKIDVAKFIRFPDGTTQTTAWTGDFYGPRFFSPVISIDISLGYNDIFNAVNNATDSVIFAYNTATQQIYVVNTATSEVNVIGNSTGSGVTSYTALTDKPPIITATINNQPTIAVGQNAGADAQYSTAVGPYALGNATGQSVIGVGGGAGYNSHANHVVAIGQDTLYNNTGDNNIAIGYFALRYNTSGVNNIAIGRNAGYAITVGSNNTVIGNLNASTSTNDTVLIGAGETERIKVDSTGLYINGQAFNGSNTYSNTFSGISGTGPQELDSLTATDFTTVKYQFRIQDGTSFEAGEIWVVVNGSDIYLSEYNLIENTGLLGTFDASRADGILTLTFTPAGATSMSIKITAEVIQA